MATLPSGPEAPCHVCFARSSSGGIATRHINTETVGTHECDQRLLCKVIDVLVHHVEACWAGDEACESGPCQSHDPDLRETSRDSCQAEGELAWHLEKHKASCGSSLTNLTHQDVRESDMFQNIAIDDEIGLASSRIGSCCHSGHGRHTRNIVYKGVGALKQIDHQIAAVATIVKDAAY